MFPTWEFQVNYCLQFSFKYATVKIRHFGNGLKILKAVDLVDFFGTIWWIHGDKYSKTKARALRTLPCSTRSFNKNVSGPSSPTLSIHYVDGENLVKNPQFEMDRLLEFLDAPEQTFRFEYDKAKGIGYDITCAKRLKSNVLPPLNYMY